MNTSGPNPWFWAQKPWVSARCGHFECRPLPKKTKKTTSGLNPGSGPENLRCRFFAALGEVYTKVTPQGESFSIQPTLAAPPSSLAGLGSAPRHHVQVPPGRSMISSCRAASVLRLTATAAARARHCAHPGSGAAPRVSAVVEAPHQRTVQGKGVCTFFAASPTACCQTHFRTAAHAMLVPVEGGRQPAPPAPAGTKLLATDPKKRPSRGRPPRTGHLAGRSCQSAMAVQYLCLGFYMPFSGQPFC